jgi:transposase
MGKRYIVTLSDSERTELKALVGKGKTQGYRIKHAQILLALDEKQSKQNWTRDEICKAYKANPSSVSQIAERFVKEGLESALGRREQLNRRRKVDGTVEAHIVAIVCSEAPAGRERWTLQLIANELVRLGVVESISDTAVCNALKKTNLSLGARSNGVFRRRELSL